MVHDDGTMDVNVDGLIQRREYTLVKQEGAMASQFIPNLKEGEQLFNTVAGRVPMIVTMRK